MFNMKNRFPILSEIQTEKPKTLYAVEGSSKGFRQIRFFCIKILQLSHPQKDNAIEMRANMY